MWEAHLLCLQKIRVEIRKISPTHNHIKKTTYKESESYNDFNV